MKWTTEEYLEMKKKTIAEYEARLKEAIKNKNTCEEQILKNSIEAVSRDIKRHKKHIKAEQTKQQLETKQHNVLFTALLLAKAIEANDKDKIEDLKHTIANFAQEMKWKLEDLNSEGKLKDGIITTSINLDTKNVI